MPRATTLSIVVLPRSWSRSSPMARRRA